MEIAVIFAIVLYVLWVLLVKGALWKVILAVFGWFGIYVFLCSQWQLDQVSPFKDDFMSWATIIPTVIILLAMASTKDE